LKKLLAATVLAVASLSANAQLSGFAFTDYTRGTGNTWYSNYENHVGLAYKLNSVGTFDAAYIYNVNYTNVKETSQGMEVGFNAGTNVNGLNLDGRLAGGGIAYDYYYVIQGELSYDKLSDGQFKPFTQVRFRDGTDVDYMSQTRLMLGTDIKLTKDTTLRIGYGYTFSKTVDTNGLTAALNVGF
jgi:hypothetical protein